VRIKPSLRGRLTPFLRVAIGLAIAVGRLHARGLIHKDVKPANVLVDVGTGAVWLTGFGLASRLPRELQAPAPPGVISLVRPILGQSKEEFGRWRDAMRQALGANGQLIVNLVPELELVIGQQPPLPDLPPQDR
jgi:serine/threonine protein kinase